MGGCDLSVPLISMLLWDISSMRKKISQESNMCGYCWSYCPGTYYCAVWKSRK